MTEQPDPSAFDVVVLGSAIHDGEFLPEFGDFVERHRSTLCRRRCARSASAWVRRCADRSGRSSATRCRPRSPTSGIALATVEYHPFGGRFDRPPDPKIRTIMWLMGARPGDHRDWADIDAWATTIAHDGAHRIAIAMKAAWGSAQPSGHWP